MLLNNTEMTKNIVKNILIFLFLLTFFDKQDAIAQQYTKEIDSLIVLVNSNELNDFDRAKICNDITWKLRNYKPEEAIKYSMEAIEAAQRSGNHLQLIKAYSYIGVCHRNIGNNTDALEYYNMGLDSAKKYNSKQDIAYAYNNLGNLYVLLENHQKAYECLSQSLQIAKELQDTSIMAYAYLNLGRAYTGLKDFPKAEEHLNKALTLRIQANMPKYQHVIVEKFIGDYYGALGKPEKAKNIYYTCMNDETVKDDYDLFASMYAKLSDIYLKEAQYDSALYYANLSLESAKFEGGQINIKNAYNAISNVYLAKEEYQEAAKTFYAEINYNDSAFGARLTEKIFNIKFSAEQYKKQRTIDNLNKENTEQSYRIAEQKNVIYLLAIVLVMGVAFVIILVKNNKKIKNLNLKLNKQQTQIADSILYAKKIQQAILPDASDFASCFSDKFILYKPRDVVSGDFYWHYEHPDYEIIAIADCTGHGVPGAFMSMLGASALYDIAVRGEHSAGIILERLRAKIKTLLKQNSIENTQKDGMDMALMVVSKPTLELEYAGAYIPLIYIRDNEIQTIKATKNPISIFIHEKPFEATKIQLQKGDCIYLSSDGFCSQFSEKNNTKLNIGIYKQLLLDNHLLPMENQKEIYEQFFDEWKGSKRQVDDILVAGFRV